MLEIIAQNKKKNCGFFDRSPSITVTFSIPAISRHALLNNSSSVLVIAYDNWESAGFPRSSFLKKEKICICQFVLKTQNSILQAYFSKPGGGRLVGGGSRGAHDPDFNNLHTNYRFLGEGWVQGPHQFEIHILFCMFNWSIKCSYGHLGLVRIIYSELG